MTKNLARMQQRGGPEEAILAADEVPLDRELIIATDTGRVWIGDGITPLSGLQSMGVLVTDPAAGVVTLPDGTRVPAVDPTTSLLPEAVMGAFDVRYVAPDALNEKLAPASVVQRRSGVAIIGDSITAYNVNVGNAWHKALAVLSGKIRHRGAFATGGYTLEQIEATHLPSVLSLNPLPGACIIAGGTNNLGATMGGTAAYDPVAARATLLRMVETLQLQGIMPVLWCPPPRNDSTTVNAATQRWNAWIRYTAQRLGLPYVDAYRAVVDPATGLYKAGYNLDQVHPNPLGHYLIGRSAGIDPEFLGRFNNDAPHLSMDVLDAANMIPSGRGLFNQGVNGSQVPTGWSAYGGQGTNYTLSQTAAVTPAAGNWQVMSKAAGSAAGAAGLQYSVTTGFTAGDRVAFAVRVQSACPDDGLSGVAGTNIEARTSGTTTLNATEGGFGGTYAGIMWLDMVVPNGTDTLRVNLNMNAANAPAGPVSVQYAQATLVNLTALETA